MSGMIKPWSLWPTCSRDGCGTLLGTYSRRDRCRRHAPSDDAIWQRAKEGKLDSAELSAARVAADLKIDISREDSNP
jgi:hypothetical protein